MSLDKVMSGNEQSEHWRRAVYDELFEQVPCNIAVIDRNMRIVDHNRNFAEIFGEGIGKPCYEVYKKRSELCAHCMTLKTFEDGEVRVNDAEGVDKDGRPAHYVVHIVPVKMPNGEIPYVIEMSTDVTDTRRLQREYHILFERVPCYVAVLNRDLRVVRANERLRKTFGKTTGEHCYEILKKRPIQCENCPAMETFKDGKVHSSEQVGISQCGKRTDYIVTTSPLSTTGSEVSHIIEVALDISDLRRLEKENIEAERLAAVGQTVAGLAHGIKNILTGLEGGMYVFRGGMEKNDHERITRGWGMLERNIGRISTLARSLLSFSKGDAPEASMVDPVELAREVVELYNDAVQGSNVSLAVEARGKVKPAPMDREGIHSCLANLVSNAIDACQMSEKPKCKVKVRCRDDGGNLVFEVADEGCGMDYEIKKKAFTTFFTTKKSGGTGLGLLLTRKIVQEHGGKIDLETKPGKGTVFRLRFPRKRLPALKKKD
jgi:PAS domain S-box-containing protein